MNYRFSTQLKSVHIGKYVQGLQKIPYFFPQVTISKRSGVQITRYKGKPQQRLGLGIAKSPKC